MLIGFRSNQLTPLSSCASVVVIRCTDLGTSFDKYRARWAQLPIRKVEQLFILFYRASRCWSSQYITRWEVQPCATSSGTITILEISTERWSTMAVWTSGKANLDVFGWKCYLCPWSRELFQVVFKGLLFSSNIFTIEGWNNFWMEHTLGSCIHNWSFSL